MPIYKFLVHAKNNDSRRAGYLKDAHALGFHHLQSIIVQDLYFIEGQLSQEELQQLALKLLTDPVTQSASWMELPTPHLSHRSLIRLFWKLPSAPASPTP